MKRLITNLDTNLGPVIREQLDDNFKKIQNGVDGQADALNKQILDMLGDVPLQDQNEVTQARIDSNGQSHSTLKGRLDENQLISGTALDEERQTKLEVREARGKFENLNDREDDQEANINNALDNSNNASYIANLAIDRANAMINGGPNGTFESISDLEKQFPNGDKHIYVVKADNNWYFWDGKKWQPGGEFIDNTTEDFTKNKTRQKLNQFNQELIKGKRLVGYNDDGSIKINAANDSAYVSFSSDGMTEGILRVPFYSNFRLGQFIIICDKDDKVIYSYGYSSLADSLNAGENTKFFSFPSYDLIDISIKQLLSAVDGTPVKILLGFPIEADKDHLNLYLKNSIRSENYMPWIKQIRQLCVMRLITEQHLLHVILMVVLYMAHQQIN